MNAPKRTAKLIPADVEGAFDSVGVSPAGESSRRRRSDKYEYTLVQEYITRMHLRNSASFHWGSGREKFLWAAVLFSGIAGVKVKRLGNMAGRLLLPLRPFYLKSELFLEWYRGMKHGILAMNIVTVENRYM